MLHGRGRPVTLPPASSSCQPTLEGTAHISLVTAGLKIALDFVQTNTAAGPTWMCHVFMATLRDDAMTGDGLALLAPGKPDAEPVSTPISLFRSHQTSISHGLWDLP